MRLRPAVAEDARLLFEWANDPVTRRYSFSPQRIPWDMHQAWYAKKLADSDTMILILELDDGRPVGQIRFDETEEGLEVDVSVDPSWRGQGYGRELVRLGLDAVRRWDRSVGKTVIAKVLPQNEASYRLFTGAGFHLCGLRQGPVPCGQFERSLAEAPTKEGPWKRSSS